MTATTVFTNGRIYTMDAKQPTATAMAIQNNRVLAIGGDDAMKRLLSPQGQLIDLENRCVTPGLVDAHVHFQKYSQGLQQVNLDGCGSLDEALQRIITRLKASTFASHDWLEGRGWNQEQWASREFPTAAHLDSITTQQPVFMVHKSGHAAWANSRALRIAGIDDNTPDPSGGQIQRDADGQTTGILLEDAIQLVSKHIPRLTLDFFTNAMRYAQEVCWRAGLTGLHDFDGSTCFQALQILHMNEELGLRFIKNIPVHLIENAVEVGLRSGFGDNWLRIGGIKIFADGALGPRTAAMIAPFENEPDNYGLVVTDKEEMMEKTSQASAHGLSVTIHAIGDKANHDVLDVYETVRQEEATRPSSPSLRHRIEHVQIIHPNDLHRLAQLNVIASMQPIHATSDMEMADRNWGERAKYSYAWRSVLETGATLVFGSDAPVEEIAPLPGIHAAVTRRCADGHPDPDGWYPEQKLTIQETIHAFTLAAAITGGQEAKLGSITPGKLADLTIYDRDIFTIPPDELLEVNIAGTIVDGEFKYRTW